ncbi:MAG: hypothetical protein HQK87_01135, partial [Nitrospinae bacterium]|nr:hypothetical protein [Nitrospinota bacterium]
MTTQTGERWSRWGGDLLLLFAAADLVSISVAQMAAAGMALCVIALHRTTRRPFDGSPLLWPLALFAGASLLSALFSHDPAESLKDSKDLLHMAIFFAAYRLFADDPSLAPRAFRFMGAAGLAMAAVGFGQALARGIDLADRISGFNDMYMTYAGLQMLAIVAVTAVILFDRCGRRDLWLGVSLLFMGGATLLSLTRNAWIGAGLGMATVGGLRKPAALLALPFVALALYAAAP